MRTIIGLPLAIVLGVVGVSSGCDCSGGSSGGMSGSDGGGGGGPFAQIIDLGPAFGTAQSAINDSGLMVGEIFPDQTNHFADSWQAGGQFNALPGPGSQGAGTGVNTAASCVSDNGFIGGQQFTNQTDTAVPEVWLGNSMIPLKFTPSGTDVYLVEGVNNADQAVGFNGEAIGGNFNSGIPGFYWSSPKAQAQALSPLGFLPFSVNNSGVAVGAVYSQSSVEFFKVDLTKTTTATDLGLSCPNSTSLPTLRTIAINDAGTIALTTGAAFNLTEINASGAKTELGAGAMAEAINSQGDIVGKTAGGHAFIYSPSTGLVDMNRYVKGSTGFTLTEAYSINAGGQVLAFANGSGGGLHCLLIQLPAKTF